MFADKKYRVYFSGNSEDTIHMERLSKDKQYFWEIWQLYERKVFIYCLRRLTDNYHDAEDLCSDTMLKAYEKMPYVGQNINILAWLISVCKNTHFDILRRRNIYYKYQTDTMALDSDIDEHSVMRKIKHAHALRHIGGIISKMPNQMGIFSQEYFFKEKSYREISLENDCSESYVRKQIYKVRQQLEPAYHRYINTLS